jgi:hypothetical protein
MAVYKPRRRVWLAATVAATTSAWHSSTLGSAAPWHVRTLAAAEPMGQVHAGGPTGLLGIGASGALWALSPAGNAPQRLASGLDPRSPLASGHGRLAARTDDGGLWVWEAGQASTLTNAGLAAHAGLLVLPLAVVAVVRTAGDAASARGSREAEITGYRLARFEANGSAQWREVARSADAVLPDARPVQVDLDGRGDGGHIAVLGGPDGRRYTHGVLGDAIEATRLLWLERHGLEVLRVLDVEAPYVFEDLAPRPVQLTDARSGAGLLTVRSGPQGGQLALVTADPSQPRRLHVAALGDTVGGFHRWLAPTTQGRHWLAVHTPHIGGVLHVYRRDGQHLMRRRLVSDVSTHAIGSRETDLSVWLRGQLVLPSQDGRRLRVLNSEADWAETASVALSARLTAAIALAEIPAMVALLADGQVVLVRRQ